MTTEQINTIVAMLTTNLQDIAKKIAEERVDTVMEWALKRFQLDDLSLHLAARNAVKKAVDQMVADHVNIKVSFSMREEQ